MFECSPYKQSAEVFDYCQKSDESLVLLAKEGDVAATEVLVNRYRNFAKTCSKSYFLAGADREDVIQEGMIGLCKAVISFDAGKEVSFKTFAKLCIKRQIISAVKMSTRQKHRPLNGYVSLSGGDDGIDLEYLRFQTTKESADPEKLVIEKETMSDTHEQLDKVLSPFEAKVLMYHLNGIPYGRIAVYLNKDPKSIDNALQRIKHKVENFLH